MQTTNSTSFARYAAEEFPDLTFIPRVFVAALRGRSDLKRPRLPPPRPQRVLSYSSSISSDLNEFQACAEREMHALPSCSMESLPCDKIQGDSHTSYLILGMKRLWNAISVSSRPWVDTTCHGTEMFRNSSIEQHPSSWLK